MFYCPTGICPNCGYCRCCGRGRCTRPWVPIMPVCPKPYIGTPVQPTYIGDAIGQARNAIRC